MGYYIAQATFNLAHEKSEQNAIKSLELEAKKT